MLPYDKLEHFAAGSLATFLGIAVGMLTLHLGANASPIWCGVFVCFLAAVLREAWNQSHGGMFSPSDIAATMSGAPLVLGAFWLGGAR